DMDVETIDQPSPLHFPPPPKRALAAGCLGLLVGLAAAYAAAEVMFRHDGKAGGVFLLLFGPFLAGAGGGVGLAAESYGWARVRPAAWALLLGFVLSPEKPTLWVVAGTAGGAFSGVLRCSWADTWRWALLGAALGLASWVVNWEYWRLLILLA